MPSSEVPSFGALTHLFHSSADCIKLLDLDGRLLHMNIGGAATMELDHLGQFVGEDWVAFWNADERAAARDAIEQAKAGGVGRSSGFLPTAKGTPKWWDSIVTPVLGPDGTIAQLLVVSRDVSERHRADEDRRALHAELQAALRRTEAIIRATSEIVWRADAGLRTITEHGWAAFTGQDLAQGGASVWLAAIHPEDRDRISAGTRDGFARGAEHQAEYRLRHHSGAYRWVEDRVVPIRDGNGAVVEWVGVVSDIDARVVADLALGESEERLRLALAASGVGIWDVDLVSSGRRWSAELKAVLGLHKDVEESEALLLSIIHPDDRETVAGAHRGAFLQTSGFPAIRFRINRADTGEERWILSSGRAVVDGTGRPVRRIGTFQDITDQKRAEERLWDSANKDPLTSLPNRNRFSLDLEKALADAEGHHRRVALFIVDLDNFKEVNDTLGHDAGDHVLRAIADRLTAFRTSSVTIARLGGDEFAVLASDAGPVAEVQAEATNVIRALTEPIALVTGAVNCFASIGVAIYPDHDCDGRELLKNADLALYNAKRAGRARHALFDVSMKGALLRRVGVLQRARDALAKREIVPFYQPKVALAGDEVWGFEALLRLQDNSRDGAGVIGPSAIAEAFDDPELSVQIGQSMLEAVIADIRAWRHAGLAFGSVAVNVSAAEFSRLNVAETWLHQLGRAGLPTSVLQMEVTESVFLDGGSDVVGQALAVLNQAGIEVALDDFGTGFASLTHLRKFPVSWLKIDQSFVRDLGSDRNANAIVSSIITLAKGIGMRVVAEGVETPAQAAILARMGCDTAQGYLASRPMPASRVAGFLGNWRGLSTERLAVEHLGHRAVPFVGQI